MPLGCCLLSVLHTPISQECKPIPWPHLDSIGVGLGRRSWPWPTGSRVFARPKVEHSHSPSQEFCIKLKTHRANFYVSWMESKQRRYYSALNCIWEMQGGYVFHHTHQRSKESLFSEKVKKARSEDKTWKETPSDSDIRPLRLGPALLEARLHLCLWVPGGTPKCWRPFCSFCLSKVNSFERAYGSGNGQLL